MMAGRFSAMNLTPRFRRGDRGSAVASGEFSSKSKAYHKGGNDKTSSLTSSSHHCPSSKSRQVSLRQRMRYHWEKSSTGSKLCYTILAFFMARYVILETFDDFFYARSGTQSVVATVETSFAVAINTYKRPDMLRIAVRHYAETCGRQAGISQVFVIWAEQNAPVVPEPHSFFDDDPSSSSSSSSLSYPQLRKKDGSNSQSNDNRSEVYVLQKDKDSLNSRFEPIDALQTTAVLMVDDDVQVSCPSLVHGFRAWNSHPHSMVGYYPRLALPSKPDSAATTTSVTTTLEYHRWTDIYYHHSFNFVLTKASFLHSKYLDLYSGPQFPHEIRDHVDSHMNCEDIAMSMLVANYTKYESTLSSTTTRVSNSGGGGGGGGTPAPPIYVEGRVIDHGLFGGISAGVGHGPTRSECLTQFSAIFESKGWGSPLSYQVPLRDYSWIRHWPGFWWQFRPSNYYEW